MNLHAPVHYRIEAGPAISSQAKPARRLPALPPLPSSADARDLNPCAEISLAISPASRPGAERPGTGHSGTEVATGAPTGAGNRFELGAGLRVVNERPRHLALSIAVALLISLSCWKTARFWSWLTRHETSAWIVLSVIWCLWLDPSWVGPLVALIACTRALLRREPAPAE